MFIPRGKLIQENLATSYVLVEPLVEDLQEGGFSGLVEIVLRETDGYIVFDGGNVAGILEKHGEVYTGTTVAELAASSRLERGRIAISAYSPATASLLAGRLNAETLYAGLSTEFTDAEKMILKLARETEREWFIEVNAGSGLSALIHMREGRCRVITSREEADVEESDAADLASNDTLAELLYECSVVGGTFDVCFAHANEVPLDAYRPVALEASAAAASSGPFTMPAYEDPAELPTESHQSGAAPEPAAIDSPIDSTLDAETFNSPDIPSVEPVETFNPADFPPLEPVETFNPPADFPPLEPVPETFNPPDFPPLEAVETSLESVETSDEKEASPGSNELAKAVNASEPGEPDAVTLTSLTDELKTLATDDLILTVEEPGAVIEVETKTEVKRLMAEIARVIEEAAQSVGPHDSFLMCLRGGQIKVADRYPFLDPFAGEFEYLAGEIVFVGQATADEFVAGFSEALTLAVQAVTRSTAYPDRFRAYIAEDLKKLLARNQAEFEGFGLDLVIAHLMSLH